MFYFLYLCILIDSCLIQSGVSITFTNNTYFLHFVWLVFVFSDFFGWFVFHFTNILQCVINNLTTVSPVYSQDFVVHQRADSLILLFYSETDPVLSGVMGLISELKPEQHNLHLWRHNLSTCREQWHTLHSLRSDQFSWEYINKEKEQTQITNKHVWWIIVLRSKMSQNKYMSLI